MLKQRILTAVILIPLLLAALFYLPPSALLLVTALIALYAAWEWSALIQIKTKSGRFLYVLIMASLFLSALFVPITALFVGAFFFWLLACASVFAYPHGKQFWHKGWLGRGVMGVCVLLPCWASINFIRHSDQGMYPLLFLFALIWGADSAAYFAGRKWGKTKLAKAVSPGKTWEGALAAFVFTLIFTGFIFYWNQFPLSALASGFLLAVIVVFFSIIGDLFESMLKREAHLKDSGNILPGHGGLLDRIDSLTAAAPIFALGALILSKY
jgi:phosphatidate cytidylyltransferase